MRNSIVVYRIKSENPEFEDMNLSWAEARQLVNMGIIVPAHDLNQVIREGNTTVTVYVHRKAD